MNTTIHPTAIINENAKIGNGCYIGPYCIINKDTSIGKNSYLHSHIIIGTNTTIGKNAKIYPFASIGMQSQDLKYELKNNTYAIIGDNVIIRESVTIHRGTSDNTQTTIGNNCTLLTLCHIGHNCKIGNNIIISHNAGLAGHVTVDDFANIGAFSGAHQFCYIGQYAMLASMGKLNQDLLPFSIAEGTPSAMRIVNTVAMKRNGFSTEEIKIARYAFKIILKNSLNITEAIEVIQKKYPHNKIIKIFLKGIKKSTRGLARP